MNRLVATAALVLSLPLASIAAATPTWSANGAIGLGKSSYSVDESAGSVTLSAIRVGGKTGVYTVTYTTANGTAKAGTDFTTASGTITWASGDNSTKIFTVPLNSKSVFSGSRTFKVLLSANASTTLLGSPSNASIVLTSGGVTAPTSPPPPVVKSIKTWGVPCDDTTDASSQLEAAITAAANNAYQLQIDCPVRFHTGTNINHTINVPDGVTIKFVGAGELLTVSGGAESLNVAHPTEVTFLDYNLTYL